MTAKIAVLVMASIALLAATSLSATADEIPDTKPPLEEDEGWLIAPAPEGDDTTFYILEDGEDVFALGSDGNETDDSDQLVYALETETDEDEDRSLAVLGLPVLGLIAACAALAVAAVAITRKTRE
ncbi:MAG: hypothetical protein PHZ19_05135 [Candidatus Thermoplasmatota archaeon]|nr:hypothetical protein [Candidatus Thermoplasmatota archaeon]